MLQHFWCWHWPWYPLLPSPPKRGGFQHPLIWFGEVPTDGLGDQGRRNSSSDICSQSGL